MLRGRSHRDRIRAHTSRTRVPIFLALLLVAGIAPMKFYMLREFLVILFLLAVTTLAIFTFSVALILSQETLLWTILWTKAGITRFARFVRVSPEAPSLRRR